MNVLSLFDGMSCGRIALDKVGIKVDNYFACEIDKYAMEISKKNYPSIVQLGDITKLGVAKPYLSTWFYDLENMDKLASVEGGSDTIDLVIGGSPCQSFSNAGDGSGFDGSSKLFWEFVRVLKEVKAINPNVKFLLENVHMKKEWEDVITEAMGVEPIKINSRLLTAQNRPRIYWTNIEGIEQPEDKGIVLKDILLDLDEVEDKFLLSEKAIAYMDRLRNGKPRWEFHKNPLDGKASCLTQNMFKGVPYGVIKEQMRRLTPLECERAQTVPDNYTEGVSNTQRFRMIGNGWSPDVIAHMFENLK